MSGQNKDAERAAFEVWYAEYACVTTDRVKTWRSGCGYREEYSGACIAWEVWQARASLPVGVPEGWVDAGERRPITWEDQDGEIELQVYDGDSVSTAVFYKRGERAGWKRVGVQGSIQAWRYLAAAPTVKDEQVQCATPSGNACPGDGVGACKACPSLPAAGSAVEEVEVVGYLFKANRDATETFLSKDGGFFAHHTREPLMTVALHERIVAYMAALRDHDPINTPYLMFCLNKWWPCSERQLNAARDRNYPIIALSAQQSAPEPVMEQTGKLLVSAEPLRQVLNALVNAPHMIRELQATREPVALFADNPINVLIAEFNAAHGGE